MFAGVNSPKIFSFVTIAMYPASEVSFVPGISAAVPNQSLPCCCASSFKYGGPLSHSFGGDGLCHGHAVAGWRSVRAATAAVE